MRSGDGGRHDRLDGERGGRQRRERGRGKTAERESRELLRVAPRRFRNLRHMIWPSKFDIQYVQREM